MSLNGVVHTVGSVNGSISTPEILTSAGTALAANGKRVGWGIKNLSGTNPLFVRIGGTASSTVFHHVFAPGTGQDDGQGGGIDVLSGVVTTELISVAGTSPRFVIYEITTN